MTPDEIIAAIEAGQPCPAELSLPLQSLWTAQAGNWDGAHTLCQEANNQAGDWVHAYLHRVEGDLGNAQYWYSRAGEKMPDCSLPEEWRQLVEALSEPT